MATRKPIPIPRPRQNQSTIGPSPRSTQDDFAPQIPDSRPVKLLLTPQEAAEALAIDRSTLYVLLMRGEIRSIKIGRARRIPVRALEQWIAMQIAA